MTSRGAFFYALIIALFFSPCTCTGTVYVAPRLHETMSRRNQEYLIGVVSFLLVTLAAVLGIGFMMNINYDDDTLLMVEVPEDTYRGD